MRNPVKGGEWKNKGAEIAIAELNDAVSLENAFKNTSGVFVMTPPLHDSDDPLGDHNQMLDALVTAIKKAKSKKVIYLFFNWGAPKKRHRSYQKKLRHGTGAAKVGYSNGRHSQRCSLSVYGQFLKEVVCLARQKKRQAGQLFKSGGIIDTYGVSTDDIGKLVQP